MLKSSGGLFGLTALISVLIAPALAQVNAVACSVDAYDWAKNSLGQDACLQAAYVVAACNNGVANITALIDPEGGSVYTGPSGIDNGDICKCNTVGYSIISACAGCQGGSWLPYSAFVQNCTATSPLTEWPTTVDIPADTAFPDWAFQNLTAGTWSNATASAYRQKDSNEQTSSTYPPKSTSSKSGGGSNAGAIAGGVVGGVVGVALLAGLAYWLWRRRRATQAKNLAPSAVYLASTPGPQETSFRSSVPITQRKLYDPSDPSTFPDAPFASYQDSEPGTPGHTTASYHRPMTSVGSRSDFATEASNYRHGLPEV
ncbi:hypothetical protein PENSPDRAFT_682885 [Peniophora sp. CONT]|nr:hypothetical protein PENSPDRAFT_682885 [Peniophora sp. CONT]